MSSEAWLGLVSMTRIATRITSISQQVADQDRALAFYVDVLGCQVRADMEIWPGARWVEVVPPGSDVGIALLTAESGLPIGVRFGTDDADAAHASLTAAGARVGEEVLRLDFAPPMFTFSDPDNNLLILIEEEDGQHGRQEGGSDGGGTASA
jgi:catechol 2,3-dioxygenase-like lactoylglutathione lyase family enzyme